VISDAVVRSIMGKPHVCWVGHAASALRPVNVRAATATRTCRGVWGKERKPCIL